MRLLLVAARFLTRLPLPGVTLRDDDLARASGLFPLVGLVVAALATAGWAVGWLVGGPLVAGVLAVGTGVVMTGAFHDDGLADVADGWFGGWDRGQRLAIMRDPRVGTFGAAALALSLLAEVALLGALFTPRSAAGLTPPPRLDAALPVAAAALATAHVVGRAGILVARRCAPVSRAGGGLSRLVALEHAPATTAVGVVTAAVVTIVAVGAWAPAVLVAAGLAAAGMARWSLTKVGGLTGDVLGAAARVCHLVALAGVVAVVRPA